MTARMKRTTDPTDLAPATISESDGVRYLHLGTPWVQGAMRIRKPLGLELEYIQRMMAWMLMRPSAALTRGHAIDRIEAVLVAQRTLRGRRAPLASMH